MAKDISQFLNKINKELIIRILLLCLTWIIAISGIFYTSNLIFREKLKNSLKAQIELSVDSANYDQILRYFSQMETLQFVTCPTIKVQMPNESPRILVHSNDLKCKIKFWKLFSTKETIIIATPNNKIWDISYNYFTDQFSIILFLFLITLGCILIITFNYFQAKIRKQKEIADLKDFEIKNSLFIEARKFAHDIRSPLSAFNAIAYSLKSTHPEQVSLINSSLQKINELTNSFLNSIKQSPKSALNEEKNYTSISEIQKIIFNEVEQKFLEFEKISSGKIELFQKNETTGKFNDRIVMLPPITIKRIISNLINNAVESILAEGTVSIQLNNNSSFTFILITDNGVGIPDEILKELGSQIITSKKYGNGFGVYDSAKAIQSISGGIRFSSSSKGTQCELKIPTHLKAK